MPRRSGPKKSGKPQRTPAAPAVPPELKSMLDQFRQLVRDCPEGWGMIAEVLRQDRSVDPADLLPFLAQSIGKEALPLLRGLALEEDETLALPALRALPLLGSRAAGEALVEAYAAYPEGERAALATQGVAALQARGINVTVPSLSGARQVVPEYRLRETWESLPDGVGSRHLTARLQDRYGVWHAIMLVWNDRAGVKDAFTEPYSRQDWEGTLAMMSSQGILFAQVPPDYARRQVARAREVNARTGFPLEDRLELWDEVIGPSPEAYQLPDPLEWVRGESPPDEVEFTDQLDEVLALPAFQSWALEPADCRPWLRQYEELDDVDDEEEYNRGLREAAAEVARKVVTPDMAALYRERLLDSARKLYWRHQEAQAKVLARAVQEMDTSSDPGEVTFLREMAVNGLAMLTEMLDGGVDPEQERYDPMQVVSGEEVSGEW